MSQFSDIEQVEASPSQAATFASKSHRLQTSKALKNLSLPELHAGKKEAACVSKEASYSNRWETPQVGVLRGLSAYKTAYNNTDDIVKHLSVVYLFTVLLTPPKWTPETFASIEEAESTITTSKLESTLPIYNDGKRYNIHLSRTLAKGRFVTARRSLGLGIHQALAMIKHGKAAIWKCEKAHFFLIRRVQTGWYFYAPRLPERPVLMFFSCPRLMVELVQMHLGCTARAKYCLSNVVLHSVEEDDTVRIVWKMKRSVGMTLIDPMESLLHGNVYLVRPSLERSLEIGLNVLDRAGSAEAKPRSWDNKTLNGCFKRTHNSWKAAEKIAAFLRDKNEPSFAAELYQIACRSCPMGHRQRKHFEEVVNYLLASCTALLVVGLDCCFVLWARENFYYWFSPYRYSSLREKANQVRNRASFLHMTNALPKASQSLYEYLYELGIFPDHTIELLPLRVDEGRGSDGTGSSGDDDSLDQEELIISPASEEGWRSFYTPVGHSPSELRLARQMLDTVYRTVEDRCD